jgi:Transposase DDE domain
MALKITPGNRADSTVLDEMTRHLAGKLYADKGYIGRELFQTLWQRGLHLITGIRRNMRNYLMPLADKILLRKRFVIETVLDTLKSEMGLEHSRHRSPVNAMVHLLSCLVAYAFRPGKPAISLKAKQLQAYP